MKIESDLRIAIKAKERAQTTPTWQEKENLNREAIQALLNKPKYKTRWKRDMAALKRADIIKKRACQIFDTLGIGHDLKRVYNEDRFIKAGGKFPSKKMNWKADHIIASITACENQKQVDAILKSIGINWK